jgi:hypothetical protein
MWKDYIPWRIVDYWHFSDHFVQRISQKAAAWGIRDTAKARLINGHTAWVAAQVVAHNPETRTHIAIEKAQRLRKADIANIRWMVNSYVNPNVDDLFTVEDRLDLGLHIKATRIHHHPAPVSRPVTEVRPSAQYQQTVTVLNAETQKKKKPADAYKIRYAWHIGNSVPLKPTDLGNIRSSRKPSLPFAWEPNDQGKPIHYATAYENFTGEIGPWSAIVSTIIP